MLRGREGDDEDDDDDDRYLTMILVCTWVWAGLL